jgi:hypothetical protein
MLTEGWTKAESTVKVLIDTVSHAGCIAASVSTIKDKTPLHRMRPLREAVKTIFLYDVFCGA